MSKRKTKLNITENNAMFFAVVAVLLLMIVLILYNNDLGNVKASISNISLSDMSNGWVMPDDEIVALPASLHTEKDTPSSISHKLPSAFDKGYSLVFKSEYQQIKVYLDDELIYEYKRPDNQLLLRSAAKRINVVDIPENSSGKTITISSSSPYKDFSGRFERISFGATALVKESIIRTNLVPFILSVAITMFGLATLFIWAIRLIKKSSMSEIMWFAVFLIDIGIFLISTSDISYYILSGSILCTSTQLASFIFLPIPYLMFFLERQQGIVKKAINIIVILTLAYITISSILLATNVIDMYMMTQISKVAVLFAAYFCIVCNIACHKDIIISIMCFIFITFIAIYYEATLSVTMVATVAAIFYCIYTVNRLLTNSIERENEAAVMSLREKRAEDYLRANQINTHFFYHVMFDTRSLILEDPQGAYNALGDFSKYLRYKTDAVSIASGIVSFHNELKSIRAYCNLQHMMFPDRINVVYDIETDDFNIPLLTIQPMVENAIEHGLKPKRQGGTVTIKVREHKTSYEVTITDDGVGYNMDAYSNSNHVSVSQQNIIDRIRNYGDNFMVINSVPDEGTQVKFRFVKGITEIYSENDNS